jgi:hypothetical protein
MSSFLFFQRSHGDPSYFCAYRLAYSRYNIIRLYVYPVFLRLLKAYNLDIYKDYGLYSYNNVLNVLFPHAKED